MVLLVLSDAAQLPNMPLAAAPSYLLLPELAEVAGLMQPAVPAAEYEFALEAKFAMTEAFMMSMACAGHLMSVDCLYNIGWRAGASSCETWHCQLLPNYNGARMSWPQGIQTWVLLSSLKAAPTCMLKLLRRLEVDFRTLSNTTY